MKPPGSATRHVHTMTPPDKQSAGGNAKPAQALSPGRLALFLAVAVFLCEMLIHAFLGQLPFVFIWAPLIDSIILLLALVPVYFFVYRPFWRARDAANDEIRLLSRQIIKTVEDERERLARDLHDDAGQYLAALKLGVATLQLSIGEQRPDLHQQVDRLENLVDQTHARVHEVVTSLRPPDLVQNGLIGALKELIEKCEQRFPQVRVTFDVEGCEERLNAETDTALYRICQESLCNAVRHGHAGHIQVELRCRLDEVRLLVRDDGQGFDSSRKAELDERFEGVGLVGMHERVAALGGRLSIESAPGQGTLIDAVIPVAERNVS